MATARDVYTLVCFDLWEDGQLRLGVITDQEFIDFLNLTVTEFLKDTCPYLWIYTQVVNGGQARYTFPDYLMRADMAFLGGVWLDPSTVADLYTGSRSWRFGQDTPTGWHADELPPNTIELAPLPRDNSLYIPGDNEPDPPHAQTGSFNITDQSNAVIAPDLHGGLTIIAPVGLYQPITTLDSAIPPLADDFILGYLTAGVLWRIYSGDNEHHDLARADYFRAQFDEGIMLLQAITNEQGADQ